MASLGTALFTSAATGYEKPHTEMFTLALANAGTSSRVWMVGDNPSADIAGAERVGIPALLVRSGTLDLTTNRDLLWAASVILDSAASADN
jgi:putative hydrolase of the HAD superfamily